MRYRDVTLGVAILGGQVDFRMAAGPWWAGFLLAVLGLVAVGVRIVFPQDSRDKVAWWRERWRTSRPQPERRVLPRTANPGKTSARHPGSNIVDRRAPPGAHNDPLSCRTRSIRPGRAGGGR
jgi:hypothetical protein